MLYDTLFYILANDPYFEDALLFLVSGYMNLHGNKVLRGKVFGTYILQGPIIFCPAPPQSNYIVSGPARPKAICHQPQNY